MHCGACIVVYTIYYYLYKKFNSGEKTDGAGRESVQQAAEI